MTAVAGESVCEDFISASELAALKCQQQEMRVEIESLRALVDRLYAELGVTRN